MDTRRLTSAVLLVGTMVALLMGISGCQAFSTQGDLAAEDWCYVRDVDKITFYPIIKNVGPADWASKQEGVYFIGATMASTTVQQNYKLKAAPDFSLSAGAVRKLEGGITLPFIVGEHYSLINLWTFEHPEDTNASNNAHPGVSEALYVADFAANGKMYEKRCNK